ncbi:MAG: YqeG family HAD IIIA-type phosphatase [Oscillospiraceae bacterium]|nr:YqeG family HAD IIIA-type phosphatase [Oscillospiraceae bacterium]
MFKTMIAVRSVCDITPQLLRSMGVKGLLLDIDNTLTTHDNPAPAEGVLDWIAEMKQAGIRMRLVSNNHEPRVKPFAEMLGIPCVCESLKPLSRGFIQAMQEMHLPKESLCVVGDQIYTDIWGANLFGVKSIYVRPMQKETWKGHEFLCIKRVLEVPFLPKDYQYLPAKIKKES